MGKKGIWKMKYDLIGKKFNRWTVLEPSHQDKFRVKYWHCICVCGKKKVVNGNSLQNGRSKSCGCLQKESARENKRHGMWGTKLYQVWAGMKQRCENKKSKAYANYDGRGIIVCLEWNDPKCFMDWALSNGYKEGLQLDRIDNNKGYSPENCRFVTPQVNECNRRNNVLLTIGNKTKSISEWSRKVGCKKDLISSRLKLGWSPESAVFTPAKKIRGVNS